MTVIDMTKRGTPGVVHRDATPGLLKLVRVIHKHPYVLLLSLAQDPSLVRRLVEPFPQLEREIAATFARHPGRGGRRKHTEALRNLVTRIWKDLEAQEPGRKATSIDAEVADHFSIPPFPRLFGRLSENSIRHIVRSSEGKAPTDVDRRQRRTRRGN